MATTTKRTSRLEIRITPDQRRYIERAAALKGATLTQWVSQHLVDAAEHDIEQEQRIKLSNKAFDSLLKKLDEPVTQEQKDFMAREPQWA